MLLVAISFLVASLWPPRCQAALSQTSYEVDILSPTPGGRYRVNPDRGIAVVVAIQNKSAAKRYGCRFFWEARSPHVDEIGINQFVSFGDIGFDPDGSVGIYARYDLQDGNDDKDDIYIGLTHQFLYSGTGDQSTGHPSKSMPAGEYMFSWHVSTGSTCWTNASGSAFGLSGEAGKGSFNFTVDDHAPWPDLRPAPCAAVAAQAKLQCNWVIPC